MDDAKRSQIESIQNSPGFAERQARFKRIVSRGTPAIGIVDNINEDAAAIINLGVAGPHKRIIVFNERVLDDRIYDLVTGICASYEFEHEDITGPVTIKVWSDGHAYVSTPNGDSERSFRIKTFYRNPTVMVDSLRRKVSQAQTVTLPQHGRIRLLTP